MPFPIRDAHPAHLLLLATFLWAAATVANKALLGPMAPLVLLAVQLAPGFLLAASVAALSRARLPRGGDLRLALLLGVLNPGLSYSLGMLGLDRISASMAALLWATEPMMILALSAVVLREPLTLRLAALVAVGFAGVALVARPGGGADPAGIALVLAAVALCAVYTVFSQGLARRSDPIALLAVQHGAGLVWACGLAATVAPADGAPPAPQTLAVALVTGLAYYGLSYWLYLLALRRVPATVAGAFFNLIPLFALVLAAIFLGERLEALQWAGAALILGAAVVLVRETSAQGLPPDAPEGINAATTPVPAHDPDHPPPDRPRP